MEINEIRQTDRVDDNMIISADRQKAFDKIQLPFMILLNKLDIERT